MSARRRRFLIAGVTVAVLAVAGILLWRWAYTGDPSAAEVREAVEEVVAHRCAGEVSVEGIDDIGGPGLPEGMWRAREIVCEPDVEHARELVVDPGAEPALALQYVFRSSSAARDWLGDIDARSRGDSYVNGRTVVTPVDLSAGEWRRVRDAL